MTDSRYSTEELAFLNMVLLNPGAKLNGPEAYSKVNGSGLWTLLENDSLINAVGSYKWVVPGSAQQRVHELLAGMNKDKSVVVKVVVETDRRDVSVLKEQREALRWAIDKAYENHPSVHRFALTQLLIDVEMKLALLDRPAQGYLTQEEAAYRWVHTLDSRKRPGHG